jgi:hypothetical protein
MPEESFYRRIGPGKSVLMDQILPDPDAFKTLVEFLGDGFAKRVTKTGGT